MSIKFKIKCPKCGYVGKPEIKYEDGYHKWYCPRCGEYQN